MLRVYDTAMYICTQLYRPIPLLRIREKKARLTEAIRNMKAEPLDMDKQSSVRGAAASYSHRIYFDGDVTTSTLQHG